MRGQQETRVQMRSRAEWAVLIKEQEKSGKKPSEWAIEKDLDPKLVTWWRWKLGYGKGAGGGPRAAMVPRLLPVTVRPVLAAAPLEVLLPGNGAVVRVPREFDAEHLARVVSALGGVR